MARDFYKEMLAEKEAARKERRRVVRRQRLMVLIPLILILLAGGFFALRQILKTKDARHTSHQDTQLVRDAEDNQNSTRSETGTASPDSATALSGTATGSDAASASEPDPNYEEAVDFTAACATSTDPAKYMTLTEINEDGQNISASAFHPWYHMDFGTGGEYNQTDGIVTFRGNSFRDNPTAGRIHIRKNKFTGLWSAQTGSITYNGASWSGSGWTGQPLMAKWPKSLRRKMNMYDSAKEKDDLTEVIYACMDGNVYFLDLETGEPTRDTLHLGWTFKGSGALDPRGYPILYVGAGYDSDNGTARVFIVNLMDCSTMYTFGNDDPFSLRGHLSYFDSSALVDGKSDTLIYPGENGILYLIHLNTDFNEKTGKLSMDPDHVVKWRYQTSRTSAAKFWVGMEDSCAVYKGYLFVAENGGHLFCLDLNTLKTIWVQDILDDSNSSPVLSVENGHLYLYISTSFRLGWRSSTTATVPVWKIDAADGTIVWHHDYTCYTEDGVSGGVQSTIATGKLDLNDYIYVTVARTGEAYDGVCACLRKNTGETVWEHTAYYAWSSPVCVYNEDGSGRVIYATCAGAMYMLDPRTGEQLDKFMLSDGAIEASPAVYDDILVIGTRSCTIQGVRLE